MIQKTIGKLCLFINFFLCQLGFPISMKVSNSRGLGIFPSSFSVLA